MKRFSRYSICLAVCLSCLAGYVDTLGFLKLGGYFVSFMSGNSTRLAVKLARGDWHGALFAASLPAFFVAGVIAGTLAAQKWRGSAGVLWLVTVLLACACITSEASFPMAAIYLLVLAMGAENATFERDGDIAIGLTYMTGTLARLGQKLAFALTGRDGKGWGRHLALWLGMVSGGTAGAIGFHYFGMHGIWIAVAGAAFLACAMRKEPT